MKHLPILAILLCPLMYGCGDTPFFAKEYVWVQKEDGLAMKAPITIRVRYRWAHDTLYWSQNLTDANGTQDLRKDSWFSSDLGLLGRVVCNYWDDDNWSCIDFGPRGNVLMSQSMKDGTLTWDYWTDIRKMKKRYLVWNRPIPNL